MRAFLYFGLASILASPAAAQTAFFAIDGMHEQAGEGGLKTRQQNVDFWTEGYPSQKYVILGLIRDKNTCVYPEKPSVRYGKVAKTASKVGATAVIVLPYDAHSVDLGLNVPEHITAEQALARNGIRRMGNTVSLAPEALTYRKPEIAIGDPECGESRFVAIRYIENAK